MVLKGSKVMAESKVSDLKIKANEALELSINEGKTLLYLKVPQIMPIMKIKIWYYGMSPET